MRFVLSVLCVLAFAVHASAQNVTVNTGLCINVPGRTLVQADEATQVAYLNALASTGWKVIRTDFTWQLLEPTPQQFDFAAYDALMTRIATAGLKVIGVLDYGNPWAAPGATDDRTPPADVATFAAFAGQVAAHYKGKVAVWELWNQPNRAEYWQPAPDPARYAALVAAATKAIRKSDKKAILISGGLGTGDDVTYGKDWGFLNAAFGPKKKQRKNAKRLKGVAFQPSVLNGTGVPERTTSLTAPSLPDQLFHLEERLAEGKLTRLLPYVTSLGWQTAVNGVSEADQAAYLVRAASLAFAHQAQRLCWSQLADDGSAFGLFRAPSGTTLEAKPAVTAAATFASVVGELTFLADLTEELGLAPGSYAICFQTGKKTVIVFWSLIDGTKVSYAAIRNAAKSVSTVSLAGVVTERCKADTDTPPCDNDTTTAWPVQEITTGPIPLYFVVEER